MVTGKTSTMLCYLKRLIVALSLFTTFSVYSESCIPWNKSILGNNKLRVGSINIDAGNIFDLSKKRERRFLHRAANKLHVTTRVSVIRDQLLFSEGNLFAANKLAETERNLRRQNYLISAEVTPVELCGNHVNIQVKTRDNWTLTPGVTFSRLGGNNRTGVEIQEHNLFGLGKSLSLNYRKNSERNTKLFEYIDPQLFGSRRRLSLSLQDNSDGKGHTLDLNLPFYELDNKRSWGFRSSRLKQKTPLYNVGKITNKITNEKENHSIFYGWSKGRSTQNQINEEAITRYKVGWTFTKTDFLKSSNGLLTTPTKILESFPWIEYSNLKDEYITKTNFKTMGKIEDISLGRSFTLGMGFLHTSLGSDDII